MAGNTTEDSSNRKVTIFRTLSLEHHYVRDFNHVRICHTTRGQNGWSSLLLASYFCVSWARRSCECIICFFCLAGSCISRKQINCQSIESLLRTTLSQHRNAILKSSTTLFPELTWINLTRTIISSDDYLKLVGTAYHLYMLNIESCSNICEEAILKAKWSLPCLRSINISCNDPLTFLPLIVCAPVLLSAMSMR